MIKEAEIQLIKKEYQDLQKREAKNHKEEYVRQIYLGRCRNAMERYRLQKTSPAYPTEVHALQIGDVALATNQFELYLDYGLRIKARSPFIQTFIVQLSGSGTYLPTEKGMKGAGYSASAYDNIVGPEGGRQLVEGTLSMLNRLAAGGTKHGQPRK